MSLYILRRALLLFPVMFGVSLLVFFSIRLVPGDITDALSQSSESFTPQQAQVYRHQLGLDRPAVTQYGVWVSKLVRGDLGKSFYDKQPVSRGIISAIPVSLELAIMAVVIGTALAIPLGVISALRQDKWEDYIGRLFSIFGMSVPDFVLGTLFIVLPSIWFHWVPPITYAPFFDDPATNLKQFFLPALVLGLRSSASIMRITRSSMLEVLRSDYVRTAWAKGLPQRMVIVRHALKNAMVAPITVIGTQIGFLMGGTVIVEQIFSLPGLGKLTLDSILVRDYAQLQGNVIFLATIFVVVNLLVDLSYAWFDPRIRYS